MRVSAKAYAPVSPTLRIETGLLDELEIHPSTYLFEAISQLSRLHAATDVMAESAQSTGGPFFHNNNDLAYGFRQLGALPKWPTFCAQSSRRR